MAGLIHLYYGLGKGKTTAALGLMLRASGCGKRVVLVQFLKDSSCGELQQLALLPDITVLRGKARGAAFSWDMTDEQKRMTRDIHDENLKKAIALAENGECDLLVLDEALDAYQLGLLSDELLKKIVLQKPGALELIITGHDPTAWILEKADYITEMVKIKHPFDDGVTARRGIEF